MKRGDVRETKNGFVIYLLLRYLPKERDLNQGFKTLTLFANSAYEYAHGESDGRIQEISLDWLKENTRKCI